MNNCNSLIRPTLENAFSGNLFINEDGEDCCITLPLERSDGDFITLWVIKRGSRYQITDEGETYGLLYLSNINLDQKRRNNRIQTIQERFDLDKAKEEVSVIAEKEELGERILDVIQEYRQYHILRILGDNILKQTSERMLLHSSVN